MLLKVATVCLLNFAESSLLELKAICVMKMGRQLAGRPLKEFGLLFSVALILVHNFNNELMRLLLASTERTNFLWTVALFGNCSKCKIHSIGCYLEVGCRNTS